jgi:hypothetical protein
MSCSCRRGVSAVGWIVISRPVEVPKKDLLEGLYPRILNQEVASNSSAYPGNYNELLGVCKVKMIERWGKFDIMMIRIT